MRIPESISITLNTNTENEPSEKEIEIYSKRLKTHLIKT